MTGMFAVGRVGSFETTVRDALAGAVAPGARPTSNRQNWCAAKSFGPLVVHTPRPFCVGSRTVAPGDARAGSAVTEPVPN